MKIQFLAAVALLLSGTAAFAQLGGVVDPGQGRGPGINNGDVSITTRPALIRPGWKMAVGAKLEIGEGGHGATMTLHPTELVAERIGINMHTDDMGPTTEKVWSESIDGTAAVLAFTPEGNLVVRDATSKIIWQTYTQGKECLLHPDGKLEIKDGQGRVLFARGKR